MAKREFKLNAESWPVIGSELMKMVMAGKDYRLVCTEWRERRSLSQNAMMHSHMGEISDYLVSKGRQDCSPEWVKLMLKWKFLGQEPIEVVDIETGEKTVVDEIRHTSKLDTGEMTDFITKYLAWALDIGLQLSLPADSEYMKLMSEGYY